MKKIDKCEFMFAIWPGMTMEDTINEICQLGTFAYYKKPLKDKQMHQVVQFTKLQGFSILEEFIAKGRMDILEATQIISNRGKVYKLEKFLESLESIKVL